MNAQLYPRLDMVHTYTGEERTLIMISTFPCNELLFFGERKQCEEGFADLNGDGIISEGDIILCISLDCFTPTNDGKLKY